MVEQVDPKPALDRLEAMGAEHLWVVYADYNGRTQGKSVPRARFDHALANGVSFARANLGHTLEDHQAVGTVFGADSGDFFALPDPEALTPFPLAANTARVFCWMRQEGNEAWDGCPRTVLQRQVDALAARGFTVEVAFEPEGYLFHQGPAGEAQLYEPRGMFTIEALDVQSDLLHEANRALEAMGVLLEQVAPEYGPGQFEINLRHTPPVTAADNLLALKDVMRAAARKRGLIASFMPKPFETAAGCGLHVHISLWNQQGDNAMAGGARDPAHLSATGQAFVGGLLAHARALCGIGAPTLNSYKRLLPGSWAPAHAVYATENRSALVRIPGATRPRVEFRAGDNTSNPHLFLAALLAAGIDGLDRGLNPGQPFAGDLGQIEPAELAARGVAVLPRTAGDALDAVAADDILAAALGPLLLPEWLRVKQTELAAAETAVSPWERQTYLRV